MHYKLLITKQKNGLISLFITNYLRMKKRISKTAVAISTIFMFAFSVNAEDLENNHNSKVASNFFEIPKKADNPIQPFDKNPWYWEYKGKPNIIYILVDDLGYGDVNFGIESLNAFKNPFIKTPHLEKLASEGLVLTDHYTSSPVCSPSRAGLLTGRTPTRSNINRWIGDHDFEGNEYLRSSEITIAEKCLEAGYQTAIYGKWHLNCQDWSMTENWRTKEGTFPNQQGFQKGMVSKENPHLTPFLKSNSQKNPGDYYSMNGKWLGTLKGYTSQIITDSALVYLEKRDKTKPFFLYLPYDAVHERIYNPDIYDEMYNTGDPNKDVYYANVTYLDAQIGRFLEGLKEMGLEQNTIVFFSSDNGPEIMRLWDGSWRSYGTSFPLYGQKRTLYEGGIRVPGIIRWPGKIEPGISHEPNSTLDVMPTICELIGMKPPTDREIDGASMVPLMLEGKSVQRSKPLYWQYEFPECYNIIGEGYDSRMDGRNSNAKMYKSGVTIRSGNYALRGIFKGKFEVPEEFVLFDVVNDPVEKHELSKQKPELFGKLKSQLIHLHKSANADRLRTASSK
jgi:arylsulfatase A